MFLVHLEHLKNAFFALTLTIQIVFEVLKPLYIFMDDLNLFVIFFFKYPRIKSIQIGYMNFLHEFETFDSLAKQNKQHMQRTLID